MSHTFELRFVTLLLVFLAQIVSTLLSVANIVIGQLRGSFVTLPIFIIATNLSMGIGLLVLMILDSRRTSPISITSEILLCTMAGGIDFISAVAVLFFKSSDVICNTRSNNGSWNLCGAHFAIVALLWTTTFLLFSYAIALFYVAWRYSVLHPFAERSVWKQTVKGTPWAREPSAPGNGSGRRLRKRAPMDIDSLRRVVKDEASHPIPRHRGSTSTSSRPPAMYVRSLAPPPGLDSPVGFAERMGYFRRDAHGEYVPSSPNVSQEMLSAKRHRTKSEEIERGTVFTMQTPQFRHPSYPDLPNPFSPRPAMQGANPQPSPKLVAVNPSNRSRSSSNSSTRSSNRSNPGLAGIGTGPGLEKGNVRISVPMLLLSPQRQSLGPPSAASIRTPAGSGLLGVGNQQPFQPLTPTTPTSTQSALPPRQSFQAPQSVATPTSPHFRQAGARPGYTSTHQHSRSHPSLTATVSTVAALESAYGFNPTTPRHDQSKSLLTPSEVVRPQSSFLQVPPAAMSPSTRQRVSNAAYPLPLPPLSTYPIKSVALSAQETSRPTQAEPATAQTPAINLTPTADTLTDESPVRERPLSTVSSVSYYSTSSASHGPVPPREIFGPPGSALPAQSRTPVQQPNAVPSRRPSRSKDTPALARGLSHHGVNSQNRWGGTGNGPARRSLAAQFQQPRSEPAR
ncbi:hypothetical protein FRC07_008121 [Ceratobasidium sp. 392]|nr:hypothetical protein FRC07_008121 [Ceratobasidium sp. 392]